MEGEEILDGDFVREDSLEREEEGEQVEEEEEEDLDLEAAFEEPAGSEQYDSEASNERFERQLREDEVDESDISEFETAPAAAKARATKLKQAKRSRVRGGRNKTRSIEGTPATEVGKDVNMEDASENEDVEEDAIETGHSNEFDQMVKSIRTSGDTGRGSSTMNMGDQALMDPLNAIKEDLRAAKGFKSKTKRGRGRGVRMKKLPPELADILASAQVAYINGDMATTFNMASELIRRDAEISQAWACLAGVHQSRGDGQKEIGCRLMHAQLARDGMTWNEVRDRAEDQGNISVATYAQARALSTDPQNPEVLFTSAQYFSKNRDDKRALKSFRKLFTLEPYNIQYLKESVYIFGSQSPEIDIWEGIKYLLNGFHKHVQTFQTPYDNSIGTLYNDLDREFIQFLVDLLIMARDYEQAAIVIKQSERWFQSRMKQTFWNKMEDDSEYDPPGAVRSNDDEITEDREGYDLEIPMRARLAVIRLKLGQEEDATIHVKTLREAGIEQYADLWINVAEALMQRARYEEACDMLRQVYDEVPEPLDPSPDDPQAIEEADQRRASLLHVLGNLGECYQKLGQFDEAIAVFQSVVEESPNDMETKSKLALAHEERGKKGDYAIALRLIKEVREANRKSGLNAEDTATEDQNEGFFNEEPKTYTQLRTRARLDRVEAAAMLEQHTKVLVERLKLAEEAALAGDEMAIRLYVSDARQMVSEFRQSRKLFARDRGVRFIPRSKANQVDTSDFHMANDIDEQRLEDKIQEENAGPVTAADEDQLIHILRAGFLGISADDWLDIVVKLSILLMRDKKALEVQQMVHHMAMTDIFQPERFKVRLQFLALAAALQENDLPGILDAVRFFTHYYQYRTGPWHIISALGSGPQALEQFNNHTWQKYLVRAAKLWNVAASGGNLFWHDPLGRWVHPKSEKQLLGIERKAKGKAKQKSRSKAKKLKPAKVVTLADFEDHGSPSDDSEEDYDRESAVPTKQAMRAGLIPGFRPDQPSIPKKYALPLEVIYGQSLAVTRSFQGAIAYYLRAYAVNPYDPIISLGLGQAYLGRSLQRQCDNKMHATTLGITFLNRYRNLRKQGQPQYSEITEEIDYNFGRAFHGIGILNLAIKHYRQVLDSIEKRMSSSIDPESIKDTSLSGEAAYNLMSIFLLTESTLMAKNISDKWLAV